MSRVGTADGLGLSVSTWASGWVSLRGADPLHLRREPVRLRATLSNLPPSRGDLRLLCEVLPLRLLDASRFRQSSETSLDTPVALESLKQVIGSVKHCCGQPSLARLRRNAEHGLRPDDLHPEPRHDPGAYFIRAAFRRRARHGTWQRRQASSPQPEPRSGGLRLKEVESERPRKQGAQRRLDDHQIRHALCDESHSEFRHSERPRGCP